MLLPAFAAVRTYAIWDKDLRVFFMILGLGLIYPAGYAVSFETIPFLDREITYNCSASTLLRRP